MTRSNTGTRRVAIVHYWFVAHRGGEKVVDALLRIYPQADVFTHVIDRERFGTLADTHRVQESFIARIPGARRHYQKLLPLMPIALEQFDLRGYDLVISSESGPAKGVLTDPESLHVCYCHSPMRYLWDMYPDYRASAGRLTRYLMPPLAHYLRLWDQASANRVDRFVANSAFVRQRIAKTYRRDADILHPPVDVASFEFRPDKDDYFMLLGQLTAYKRPDIAIEAFARLGHRLVVIGEGELAERLADTVPANIELLGHQPFDVLRDYLAGARALIFPGVEDFGIVPVEALACATPVIAYARGGARETIVDGVTGIHFHEQSPEALRAAVSRFESWEPRIDRNVLRDAAIAFRPEVFEQRFRSIVDAALAELEGAS